MRHGISGRCVLCGARWCVRVPAVGYLDNDGFSQFTCALHGQGLFVLCDVRQCLRKDLWVKCLGNCSQFACTAAISGCVVFVRVVYLPAEKTHTRRLRGHWLLKGLVFGTLI